MKSEPKKRLIVIVGPTGVGKTQLAVMLAEKFQTEVISADSRQLFKEMSIGTAKPSDTELARIRHHFINYKSIKEAYDAGQYGEEALRKINSLFTEHDQLILCGGSGLYIKAVLEGFDEMPTVPGDVRQQIIEEFNAQGLAWLQSKVKEKDPDYFEQVDIQNPQRLMRALELIRHTGMPASVFRKKAKRKLPFAVIKIGLELERDVLYERIDERVDQMIAQGLIHEAKKLHSQKSNNALQTVGYQELFRYFEGEYDLDEAVRQLKQNTRRYAKRQFTWFKRDPEIRWFAPSDTKRIMKHLDGK